MFENYRPISILPAISKILEKNIFNQLHDYFQDNKLYCKNQYGFRRNHSTEYAALELIDRVILDMDKGEIPFSICIDLSKAFDTLDHKILINKLQYYGIKDTALDLFQSYLSNRRQYVQIGNNKSDTTAITTGVPQGSILGPQLFIIYINDIIKFSTIFHTIIYADDTTLVGKFRDFKICNGHSLSENINYEITKLTDWLNVNRLSLNTKKTKLMIFHTPQKKFDMPTIKINNTELEQQTHFNYLGITINKHTKWDGHVKKIAIKISKASGIIFKLNDVLPYNVLITLYNALILPHLTYGILATNFKMDIMNANIYDKLNNDEMGDPNDNYNIVETIIQDKINTLFPTRTVKFNCNKHKKNKWVTNGIIKSMYKKLKATNPDSDEFEALKINLRTYNKILKRNIKIAKSAYYQASFSKYKNDIKGTWSVIKEVLNKTQNTPDYPDSFKLDGCVYN